MAILEKLAGTPKICWNPKDDGYAETQKICFGVESKHGGFFEKPRVHSTPVGVIGGNF